jgi:hypothetical protein
LLIFDGRAEANGRVDPRTLVVGLTRRTALTPDTDSIRLAIVRWAELFGPRVRDALKRAAVFVGFTIGISGAAREASVIGTGPTRASDTLLRVRTRHIETGQQTLAIDANSGIAALEVELTPKRRRLGIVFEGVETESVVCAGRAYRAIVLLDALPNAAYRRADFADCTVRLRDAEIPLRSRLRIAVVATAEEAAAVADRAVGDTDVAGVPVAADDPEERDDENPMAFHGNFDAHAGGLFTGRNRLKAKQFR